MIENFEKKIKAYALKNAIAYKGKANPGSIVSALFNEGLKKDKVKETMPKIQKIIKEISKLSLEQQEKEFEKLKGLVSEREVREGLEELPNSSDTDSPNGSKKVVMRFAPSPSGGLHIGHAMTACLSYAYIKKYNGKFYVRIEDTNPDNIYPKAYDLIKKDSKFLFEGNAKIIIQSERMNLYYKYAEKLIKKNSAYVCTCSGDEFRKYSKEKKDCPCRKQSVKENLELWKKMLNKDGFKQGDAVLRFKTPKPGMSHKNPAMRDFPLARINLTKHALQKSKYRVWPLMNLAVSVDDIELKMTHIIRAKEHRDNAERQKMIYKVLDKKYPWCFFVGRIHLKGMRLSSTEITKDVESGKYSGWDDKRLPTVSSLKKQGYKAQAFLKFSEQVGLSQSDKIIDKEEYFKLLNAFNK